MALQTYVVAADMFSDRVKGKLIRGKRGEKVQLDSEQAERFTQGDRPTLMSESDWEKRNEQTVRGLFESAPDTPPSGATAGIVTEGVRADVPTPEDAARQKAEADRAKEGDSAEGDKSSDKEPGNTGTATGSQDDGAGSPADDGSTTEGRSDEAAQQAGTKTESGTKSNKKK